MERVTRYIMEIKRIGENQIRCALTEKEIQEMGFEIDDIIANSEMTQKFMHLVIDRVEAELGEKEKEFRLFMEKQTKQTFEAKAAPVLKLLRKMDTQRQKSRQS